jgi:homoserine O-acetyltransferase/O-succinyltransferase
LGLSGRLPQPQPFKYVLQHPSIHHPNALHNFDTFRHFNARKNLKALNRCIQSSKPAQMNLQTFTLDTSLPLERGGRLATPTIAYHTFGNPERPVVWVCHALTANSDVFDWWAGLFGPKDLFNPEDYFIVCANVLSSCYGTAGPLSENPETGVPYFHDFPQVTIRDMVVAHEALRRHLGISKIHLLLGGSLGGQQTLEWCVSNPDLIENVCLIATNARHSAWGIAFNESQRMAIEADGSWLERHARAGDTGMRAARATALISYRHYSTYEQFQTDPEPALGKYRATTYQQYQGEKLSKRFNAFSYYRLSESMDSHHVGRNRGPVEEVLQTVRAKALVVGISSDVLFPTSEQQYLAKYIPGAVYREIDSIYGHDGFLIETEKLSLLLSVFLTGKETPKLNGIKKILV